MGELHRRLTLLSPQLGLFDAVAFGARKGSGKLAGIVEPFVTGRVFAYHNPAKDQYKIQDVKVTDYHEFLRENIVDLYTASFFAEIVLKSFGSGGDHEETYVLLTELLDGIEAHKDHNHIIIQGCWRFLELFGIAPDLYYCASCGKPFHTLTSRIHPQGNELLCEHCLPASSTEYVIDYAGRRYLSYTQSLSVEKALQVSLTKSSARILKNVLLHYMDGITDGRLKTTKSGMI